MIQPDQQRIKLATLYDSYLVETIVTDCTESKHATITHTIAIITVLGYLIPPQQLRKLEGLRKKQAALVLFCSWTVSIDDPRTLCTCTTDFAKAVLIIIGSLICWCEQFPCIELQRAICFAIYIMAYICL